MTTKKQPVQPKSKEPLVEASTKLSTTKTKKSTIKSSVKPLTKSTAKPTIKTLQSEVQSKEAKLANMEAVVIDLQKTCQGLLSELNMRDEYIKVLEARGVFEMILNKISKPFKG